MLKFVAKGCYGCSMTGVRRSVGCNEGAVLVLHSPKACGQVIREKDDNAINTYIGRFEKYIPMLTTNIADQDAVFGAQHRLEACLNYAVEHYQPRYIVVANSCVSGIIGDDVDSICEMFSQENGIPVYSIPCAGFMNGGYEAGVYEAASILIDNYMQPSDERLNYVTLVGIVDKQRSFEYDLIEGTLRQWGIKINCVFPGYATVEAMEMIPKSRAILQCSISGRVAKPFLKISDKLEKKLGLPVIKLTDPVGYSNSLQWIRDLGAKLEVPKELIEKAYEELKAGYQAIVDEYKSYDIGGKAVIHVGKMPGAKANIKWLFELLELIDIKIVGISFSEEVTAQERQELLDQEQLTLPVVDLETRDKADYIFALRQEGIAGYDYIGIPYVHPVFGLVATRRYYEKILRLAVKRRHRDD